MNTIRLYSAAAVMFMLSAGVATAGPITGPVKPERAPPAQQNAPAEKVAPPMNAGSHKPAETTGQNAPDKPSSGGAGNKSRSDRDGALGAAPRNNDAAVSNPTGNADKNSLR